MAAELALPMGFAVGYTAGSGFRPHGESNSGVALGFAGALLAPPLAVKWVGTGNVPGSYGRAVAGTLGGYVAGAVVIKAAGPTGWTPLRRAVQLAGVFMPAIGAAAAYNSGRR